MTLSDQLNLETVIDNGFTDDAGNPLRGTFDVVGSTVRRTQTLGNVIGPGRFTITLDGSGNVTKQLPANVDTDIQDLSPDDYYTVTPNLTDATGKALTTPFPTFRMILVAGQGPYRLSDFIFGDEFGSPRTDLSSIVTPPSNNNGGSPADALYPSATLYPMG